MNISIELATWLAQNAINLLIQSTALIALGLFCAWLFRKQGSAVQAAIYRATLAGVLICPIVAVGLNSIGLQGWTIQLPKATRIIKYEELRLSSSKPEQPQNAELKSDNFRDNVLEDSQESPALSNPSLNNNFPDILTRKDQAEIPEEQTDFKDQTDPNVVAPIAQNDLSSGVSSIPLIKSSTNTWFESSYVFIAALWIIGTIVFLVRLYVAYTRTQQLRNHSIKVCDSESAICRKLAKRIQVNMPDVRRHSLLSSPCLTGIKSPAILLPEEICEQLSLEKAFVHELAHLRRHDTFWNLVQRIALALFFFQPLMWRLVYRLETTAEEVCDDYVVRHCTDRAGYAQQLVQLAESNLIMPNMAGLGMFSSKSTLGHRVKRILDTTRQISTQISMPTIIGIVALTMVCATLGGFLGNGTSSLTDLEPDNNVSASENVHDDDGATSDSNLKTNAQSDVIISGVVIDSSGKPVAGAELLHAECETISGDDGTFKLEIPSEKVDRHSGQKQIVRIQKTGYGLSFGYLDFANPDGQKFKLVDDKHPILGRLVDQQGNPIAGATVSVKQFHMFPGVDLEAILMESIENPNALSKLPSGLGCGGSHIPVATTDGEGNFRIDGVGSGRIATLAIVGEAITVQRINVTTTDIESLQVDKMTFPFNNGMVYGRRVTFVCEPSQPIEGVVVDRVTKEPLPGVKIIGYRLHENESSTYFEQLEETLVVSDERGRFRLTGLPIASQKMVTVEPETTGELAIPYLVETFDVPEQGGIEPVEMTIGMQKGAWIRGTVVDVDSGKPVHRASISWHPYPENEEAEKLEVQRQGELARKQHFTNENGEFQLAVVPGPALLRLNYYTDHSYPYNQGWDKIPESRKGENGITTLPFQIRSALAFKEVDATGPIDVKFELTQGKSVQIKTVDANGNEISGVHVATGRKQNDRFKTKSAEFEAGGFLPGGKRTIVLQHFEKNMGAKRVVHVDEAQPVVVKLEPMAMVTAKLVDEKKAPSQKQLQFSMLSKNEQTSTRVWPLAKTTKNGEVRQPLVPGRYLVSIDAFKGFSGYMKIEVKSGDQLDLGTIDITKRFANQSMSGPNENYIEKIPLITVESNSKQETEEEKPAMEDDNQQNKKPLANRDFKTITGTVVNASDQWPQEGVVVKFNTWKSWPNVNTKTIVETATDSNGFFTLKIPIDQYKQLNLSNQGDDHAAIVVPSMNGKGAMQINWTGTDDDQPARFCLHDENTINGTIVDLEGEKVKGASVRVTDVRVLGPSIGQKWLTELRQTDDYVAANAILNEQRQSLPYISWVSGAYQPVVQTDSNGAFTIHGLPKSSLVSLSIEHQEMTTQLVEIFNRTGGFSDDDPRYVVYSDKPTIVVQPSRPVVGQVTDAESGTPIAGALVRTENFGIDSTVYHSSPVPQAWTDVEGKFELSGLPKSSSTRLCVYPPRDNQQAYLIQDIMELPDTQGFDPVSLEIKLYRGIWISGVVTDLRTGDKVTAGELHYSPLQSNPNLQGIDGYLQSWQSDHYYFFEHFKIDSEGRFRFPGLPGPGLIVVETQDRKYRTGVDYRKMNDLYGLPNYTDQQIAEMRAEGLDIEKRNELRTHARFQMPGDYSRRWVVIDPPTDTDSFKNDIQLDSGFEVPIKVVDADGSNVDRFQVSNFAGHSGWLEDPRKEFENGHATLLRMGEDEVREIKIETLDGSSGAIANVSGDLTRKTDKTIKLQQFAKIKGRLTDQQTGRPLVGFKIWIPGASQSTTSGENGEFLVDKVLKYPGRDTLKIEQPRDDMVVMYYQYEIVKEINVDEFIPGEILELGDIEVDTSKKTEVMFGGIGG